MLHLDPLQAAGPSVPEARPDETRMSPGDICSHDAFPHHGDPTQNASKKRPKVGGFRGLFDADAKIRKKPWEVPPSIIGN